MGDLVVGEGNGRLAAHEVDDTLGVLDELPELGDDATGLVVDAGADEDIAREGLLLADVLLLVLPLDDLLGGEEKLLHAVIDAVVQVALVAVGQALDDAVLLSGHHLDGVPALHSNLL